MNWYVIRIFAFILIVGVMMFVNFAFEILSKRKTKVLKEKSMSRGEKK